MENTASARTEGDLLGGGLWTASAGWGVGGLVCLGFCGGWAPPPPPRASQLGLEVSEVSLFDHLVCASVRRAGDWGGGGVCEGYRQTGLISSVEVILGARAERVVRATAPSAFGSENRSALCIQEREGSSQHPLQE